MKRNLLAIAALLFSLAANAAWPFFTKVDTTQVTVNRTGFGVATTNNVAISNTLFSVLGVFDSALVNLVANVPNAAALDERILAVAEETIDEQVLEAMSGYTSPFSTNSSIFLSSNSYYSASVVTARVSLVTSGGVFSAGSIRTDASVSVATNITAGRDLEVFRNFSVPTNLTTGTLVGRWGSEFTNLSSTITMFAGPVTGKTVTVGSLRITGDDSELSLPGATTAYLVRRAIPVFRGAVTVGSVYADVSENTLFYEDSSLYTNRHYVTGLTYTAPLPGGKVNGFVLAPGSYLFRISSSLSSDPSAGASFAANEFMTAKFTLYDGSLNTLAAMWWLSGKMTFDYPDENAGFLPPPDPPAVSIPCDTTFSTAGDRPPITIAEGSGLITIEQDRVDASSSVVVRQATVYVEVDLLPTTTEEILGL